MNKSIKLAGMLGLLVLLAACGQPTVEEASPAEEATQGETAAEGLQSGPDEEEAPPEEEVSGDEAVLSTDASVYVVDQFPGFPAFASSRPMLEVIEDRGETVVVRHRFGETEIPKNPQRIFADATMLPTALLLDLNVVGAYHFPEMTLLPEWETLSEGIDLIDPIDYSTNYEWVSSHNPDLILVFNNVVWAPEDSDTVYNLLSEIAPTVVVGDDAVTYWQEAAIALASALDVDATALEALDNAAATLAEACVPIQEKVGDGTIARITISGGEVWLAGPGYEESGRFIPYVDAIPNLFCGLRLPEGMEELVGVVGPVQISDELIPEIQADYLLITLFGDGSEATYEGLLDNPLWQAVPAVQDGEVYVTSSYLSGTSLDTTLYAIKFYADQMTADRD